MEGAAMPRRFTEGLDRLLTPRAWRAAVTPAARTASWWRPSRQPPDTARLT